VKPHQLTVALSPLTLHDMGSCAHGESLIQHDADAGAIATVFPPLTVYVRYVSKSPAVVSVQGRSPANIFPFAHSTMH
jgi:hypothetical protein